MSQMHESVFTPELIKKMSLTLKHFLWFSFNNVEKENESLVNIVRNNSAFVP